MINRRERERERDQTSIALRQRRPPYCVTFIPRVQLSRIQSPHLSVSAAAGTVFGNPLNTVIPRPTGSVFPPIVNWQYRHTQRRRWLRLAPIGSLLRTVEFQFASGAFVLSPFPPGACRVSGTRREIVIIEQLVLGSNAIQYPIRYRGFLPTFTACLCSPYIALPYSILEAIFPCAALANRMTRGSLKGELLITFSSFFFFFFFSRALHINFGNLRLLALLSIYM